MLKKNIASLVAGFTCAISFAPITVYASNYSSFVFVKGKTNSGSKLALELNSVKIQSPTGIIGDYSRTFSYMIVHPNGTSNVHTEVSTPWCRFGRIELDGRAVDKQFIFHTQIATGKNYSKIPFWTLGNGQLIEVNSPASRNLLKAVCAANPN